MKRKLMGPCWVMIRNAQDDTFHTRFSSTRLEYTIADPKEIVVNEESLLNRPPPPMSVMTLSFRTWRNSKNKNEIVAISGGMHDTMIMDGPTENRNSRYRPFTFIRKLNNRMPNDAKSAFEGMNIEIVSDEKTMISKFIEKIAQEDPDMLIGHELCGSMLETLISRVTELNV
jgi:DNA polymerase alpha subunit A